MAKIQIKNSFITSSAQITISSSLVRFSGGISAKNITGSFSGSIPQLSSYFKQGGNSFGTTATLGTNDNQALIFETNGSERARIDTSGNLLVGNSSGTGYRLNVKAPFSSVLGGAYIEVGEYNQKTLVINNTNPSVSSNLFEAQKSGSAVFVLNASGNVGIGTTSPGTLLQVHGANPFVRISNSTAADHGIKITYGTSETHGLHLLYNANSAVSYIDNTYPVNAGLVFGDIYFRQNVAGTMTTRMTIKADGGNVGIGTTSPVAKLHVTGSSSVPAAVFIGNVGVGTTAAFTTGGTAQLSVATNVNAVALSFGSSNTDMSYIRRLSAGVYQWQTISSGANDGQIHLQPYGGNVGIGTSSPLAKLHVTGSSTIPASVFFGNVGIGTSTPGTLFQVHKAAGGNNWSWFNGNVGSNLPTGFTTGVAIGRNYSSGFSEANLIWGHGVSSNQYFAIAKISGSTSYSEQLRIDINGNVGIGTTSPTRLLQVNGTAYLGGYTTITGNVEIVKAGAYLYLNSTNSDAEIIWMTGGSPRWAMGMNVGDATENLNIYNYNTTTINLHINKTSGNIGIGTTSPRSKLEVAGTAGTGVVSIVNTTNSRSGSFGIDGSGVYIRNSNNGDYFDLKNASGVARFRVVYDNNTFLNTTFTSVGSLTASGSKLSVFGNTSIGSTYGSTAAPTNGLIVEGNVGIGTTTVDAKLRVLGNVRATSFTGSFSGSIPQLSSYFKQGGNSFGTTATLGTNDSSALSFETNGSTRMTLDTNGNLGIGTTSVSSNLHIYALTGPELRLSAGGTGTGGLRFLKGDSGVSYINNQDSYAMQFQIAGSTKMSILAGGNVGIGTTAPAYKLDVSGSISADAFLGKSFGMTGASGSTAIYDAYLSNGQGEVYELIAAGSPNAGGSSGYQDVLYGKIIIGTGYNGSRVTTYINYVQENPDPRSLYNSGLGTSLSASICFKSGSSEVTNKPAGQSTKIRVKIGSYISNAYAGYTTVRVKRLF